MFLLINQAINMTKQVNKTDREIAEEWANHVLKSDPDIKNALEKTERESMEKFIEFVMTGKTSYYISYQPKQIFSGEETRRI